MLKCKNPDNQCGRCCTECEERATQEMSCACDIAENLLQDAEIISELCRFVDSDKKV